MRYFLLLLAFCFLVSNVYAEFKSPEEVSKWMTHYYEHPNVNKVYDAIEYMSNSDMLAHKKSHAPTFGFLSGIFQTNKEKTKTLVDKFYFLKKMPKDILINGIWYANLPKSKDIVYQILEKNSKLKDSFDYLYKESPVNVVNIPFEKGPWVLDALWGYFMSTGKKEPVVRVIEVLKWSDAKDDIDKLVVGVAAKWSLTSNAIQHKKVLNICKEEIKKQPKDIGKKLEEIIKLAEDEIKIRKSKK
jgi:hypothetical protein